MSLDAMLWALKQAPVDDQGAAFVLVALADNARDDGTEAWPSVKTLATKTRCSERQVQRHLRHLEALGLIRRSGRPPAGARVDRLTNSYDLDLTRVRPPDNGVTPTSPRDTNGVTTTTERGDKQNTNGVTPTSPEQSLELPKELSEPNGSAQATQRLVGAWVEEATKRCGGRRPPKKMLGIASADIRGLVQEGRPPDEIERMARAAGAKGQPQVSREYLIVEPKIEPYSPWSAHVGAKRSPW